jgi:hypothetical protein
MHGEQKGRGKQDGAYLGDVGCRMGESAATAAGRDGVVLVADDG